MSPSLNRVWLIEIEQSLYVLLLFLLPRVAQTFPSSSFTISTPCQEIKVCVPKRVVLWYFSDCRKTQVHGNPQRMGPIKITPTNAKKRSQFDANINYTRQPVASAEKQAIGTRRRRTSARVKRGKTCNRWKPGKTPVTQLNLSGSFALVEHVTQVLQQVKLKN